MVGWPRSRARHCGCPDGILPRLGWWFAEQLGPWHLQCAGQWQYGYMLWHRFRGRPMIAELRNASRCQVMLAVVLASIVLPAAGCSLITGNCNAQGGNNSVSCGSGGPSSGGPSSGGPSSGGPSSGGPSSGGPSSGGPSSGGPSSGGPSVSLFSVAQTPSNRQESGTLTYNGQAYSKPFQLDLPWGSSASYSYALNGQWSRINLVIGIPNGGNGAANIGVAISIDGQGVGNQYIVLGSPYSDQFSVAGVKTLTISFDTGATLSATAVLVAGNLYH